MKKEMTNIFEISVTVELDGVKSCLWKYKAKFSGKNYIPAKIGDLDKTEGYYPLYRSRIPSNQILKIQSYAISDKPSCIKRHIFFLDGQLDQAKEIMRSELSNIIELMASDINKLHEVWLNRNNQ